jgi:hypothetical protein
MICPYTNVSYGPCLSFIGCFLHVKLNIRKQAVTGRNYYIIDASSELWKRVLRDYLDRFPLLSSKFLDYRCWCKGSDLIDAKLHMTLEGLTQIDNLKQNMNSNRTCFNWDHLNQL